MTFSASDLKKLVPQPPVTQPISPGEPLEVVVRVREPGYIPEGVCLRMRVDEGLFTGTLASENLEQVRADPRVIAVEPARPVQVWQKE